MYYPNEKEMDQMVRNDIAYRSKELLFGMHAFNLIAFWMILIAFLCRYAAYLYCWIDITKLEHNIVTNK